MRLGSKWIAALAVGVALLAGGIGVASAMSGDGRSTATSTAARTLGDDRTNDQDRGADDRRDANLTGAVAQRARAAALAAVPGASVRQAERETETAGAAYQVELVRPDGSEVEVNLDANYKPIKIERD